MSHLTPLPAADLDALLAESPHPVIVDFGADWCPPCRQLEPVLAAVAEQYTGRVTVRRVDAATAPELIARYGIKSIPTLVAFAPGEVGRLIGLPRPDALARLFDDALSV